MKKNEVDQDFRITKTTFRQDVEKGDLFQNPSNSCI